MPPTSQLSARHDNRRAWAATSALRAPTAIRTKPSFCRIRLKEHVNLASNRCYLLDQVDVLQLRQGVSGTFLQVANQRRPPGSRLRRRSSNAHDIIERRREVHREGPCLPTDLGFSGGQLAWKGTTHLQKRALPPGVSVIAARPVVSWRSAADPAITRRSTAASRDCRPWQRRRGGRPWFLPTRVRCRG